MIHSENIITVNKNIEDVFHTLYEDNNEIFDEHMQLIEWKKSEWNNNKRKEDIYIYLESLPDELAKYTTEGDKYLRFKIKNKIMSEKPRIIKSKFKIQNVNQFFRTLLNDFNLIKIKNTVELNPITETTTTVKVVVTAKLIIPLNKTINDFLHNLIDKITQSLVHVLDQACT
jgi:hypothetical protein